MIDNPEATLSNMIELGSGPDRGTVDKILEKLNKRNDIDGILPTAAKFVRLTFHDCLKETETGVGCNGCFNFKGVGDVWYMHIHCPNPKDEKTARFCNKHEFGLRPLVQNETDNNNLLWTGLALEHIYRGYDFDTKAADVDSLFSSGKSRADLWAFAGLVAVHKTIQNNNRKCQEAPCLLQVDETSPNCMLEPKTPAFKTGRADCVPSCGDGYPAFCTAEHENHPDPHGNGQKTAQFFASDFGLNVQEAIALLGAHTLGRTHVTTSMWASIPWTPQGKEDFNNFYYINGLNETGYRYADPSVLLNGQPQCNDQISAFTGDEEGNPVPTRFKVVAEKQTANRGPWDWQVVSTGCWANKCADVKNANNGFYPKTSCCHWLEFCQANPKDCPWENFENKRRNNWIRWNINMLNVDTGFVYDFQTDSQGRPTGCPNFENWPTEGWRANYRDNDCPINNNPSGLGLDKDGNERTFSGEVKFFAENSQAWIDIFTTTYDKMMENGVDGSALTLAPTDWFYDN